jgi:flagellar basal body rod protein FlgB
MRTESASYITDNIEEILVKIIKFTHLRHKILLDNIRNIHQSDFTPKCLDSEGFAELMNQALAEHINHNRLLWSDSQTIRFGYRGEFEVEAVIDRQAHELFGNDKGEYLQKQKQQLMENSLNNRVAIELLKQKRRLIQTIS